MAHRFFSPEELQELRDLAAQWGKIIARRTGDDALDLDLDAMEQIAQAAATGLIEGTLHLGWCLGAHEASSFSCRIRVLGRGGSCLINGSGESADFGQLGGPDGIVGPGANVLRADSE